MSRDHIEYSKPKEVQPRVEEQQAALRARRALCRRASLKAQHVEGKEGNGRVWVDRAYQLARVEALWRRVSIKRGAVCAVRNDCESSQRD